MGLTRLLRGTLRPPGRMPILRGVGAARLAGAVAISVLTVSAAANDSREVGGVYQVKSGTAVACVSAGDLKLAAEILADKDQRAFDDLIKRARCAVLNAGQLVTYRGVSGIVDYRIAKVRVRGDSQELFVFDSRLVSAPTGTPAVVTQASTACPSVAFLKMWATTNHPSQDAARAVARTGNCVELKKGVALAIAEGGHAQPYVRIQLADGGQFFVAGTAVKAVTPRQ